MCLFGPSKSATQVGLSGECEICRKVGGGVDSMAKGLDSDGVIAGPGP